MIWRVQKDPPYTPREQFAGSERTRPTLPCQRQAEHAVRRGRIDVDAKLLATLLDDIPRPIAGFEAELGDLRDVSEDAGSHLMDDLLDAGGLERFEHVHDDRAHPPRHGAVAERGI